MEDGIQETDRDENLNVQYPGENGELEPFIDSRNAKYVGLLMAHQFRRSSARIGAVNYGTGYTMATPVSSSTAQELIHYYQHLLGQPVRDKESEKLYEDMAYLRLMIDGWNEDLKEADEEEKRVLLIEIDKALVRMEEMSRKMEILANA